MAHRTHTQGDEEFWQDAFKTHAGSVLSYLERRIGREEAEDLLQETFVRAIRADTFRRDQEVRPYLMRIAKHLMISRYRRPKVTALHDEADQEDRVPARDRSPEQGAMWRGLNARLNDVLAGMSADHRAAFRLGVVEQYAYREIADQMGWSLSQVKVNIYRARRRVLEALGDELAEVRGSWS